MSADERTQRSAATDEVVRAAEHVPGSEHRGHPRPVHPAGQSAGVGAGDPEDATEPTTPRSRAQRTRSLLVSAVMAAVWVVTFGVVMTMLCAALTGDPFGWLHLRPIPEPMDYPPGIR